MNSESSLLDPDFLIQSHRGAGAAHPENTLESCEHTWAKSSLLIPESDANITLDNVLVAFHDNELDRVAKGLDASLTGKKIQEITWEQARRIDVGAYLGPKFSRQYLPRLADIFAKMKSHPSKRLYLDHKQGALPEIFELVRQFEIQRQIIFCSPTLELIRTWKNLAPGSKTLLWIWNSGQESMGKEIEQSRKLKFAGVDGIQLHIQCAPQGYFIPSADFIRNLVIELKDQHKVVQALPFEGDYAQRCPPKALHALLDLGVTSFATDFPDDVLRVVGEH